MPQQKRLVARLLPDDSHAQFDSEILRLPTSLLIAGNLVGVHEHSLVPEVGPASLAPVDLLTGPAEARNRIAGTRIEVDDLEVNRDVRIALPSAQ